MQTLTRLSIVLCLAASLGAANVVYAESAPVYDADSSGQSFDGSSDQGQDVPPPAPEQSVDQAPVPGDEAAPNEQMNAGSDGQAAADQGGTFVPADQVAPQLVQKTQNAPLPSTQGMSVDQRLKRIEQQVHNIQTIDNNQRIDSLQDQVQTLRGQVEQLQHQLEQSMAQQKSMYNDLDKRLSQTSTKSPSVDTSVPSYKRKASSLKPSASDTSANTSAAKTTTDVKNQPNVAEEQQIYQTAYDQIKAKKYTDAINTLQSMLKKYPSGQFASNAHYWLGELYGLVGKSDLALNEFSTVVKSYPDSPRIADAQLKVGLIYASQSNWTDAKSSFKKVINHYPGTASARLASEQLKQLKQAGH